MICRLASKANFVFLESLREFQRVPLLALEVGLVSLSSTHKPSVLVNLCLILEALKTEKPWGHRLSPSIAVIYQLSTVGYIAPLLLPIPEQSP
jgi:hypothetical protein